MKIKFSKLVIFAATLNFVTTCFAPGGKGEKRVDEYAPSEIEFVRVANELNKNKKRPEVKIEDRASVDALFRDRNLKAEMEEYIKNELKKTDYDESRSKTITALTTVLDRNQVRGFNPPKKAGTPRVASLPAPSTSALAPAAAKVEVASQSLPARTRPVEPGSFLVATPTLARRGSFQGEGVDAESVEGFWGDNTPEVSTTRRPLPPSPVDAPAQQQEAVQVRPLPVSQEAPASASSVSRSSSLTSLTSSLTSLGGAPEIPGIRRTLPLEESMSQAMAGAVALPEPVIAQPQTRVVAPLPQVAELPVALQIPRSAPQSSVTSEAPKPKAQVSSPLAQPTVTPTPSRPKSASSVTPPGPDTPSMLRELPTTPTPSRPANTLTGAPTASPSPRIGSGSAASSDPVSPIGMVGPRSPRPGLPETLGAQSPLTRSSSIAGLTASSRSTSQTPATPAAALGTAIDDETPAPPLSRSSSRSFSQSSFGSSTSFNLADDPTDAPVGTGPSQPARAGKRRPDALPKPPTSVPFLVEGSGVGGGARGVQKYSRATGDNLDEQHIGIVGVEATREEAATAQAAARRAARETDEAEIKARADALFKTQEAEKSALKKELAAKKEAKKQGEAEKVKAAKMAIEKAKESAESNAQWATPTARPKTAAPAKPKKGSP